MAELVVVGGGKMGEALVGGLLAAGRDPGDIVVVEPDDARRHELAASLDGVTVTDRPVVAAGALIAVKPQQVVAVCRLLGELGVNRVLSIAAGIGLAALEAELPTGTAVVRAMPNTASLVGAGAAAIAGGNGAGPDDLAWAEDILGAVGTVVRVTEAQLDAVTGLSGSGPAYVFLVAEALIDAGVRQGLSRAVATDLTVQTLRGASELLATGQSPTDLRAAITSPGGTTAAGLHALEAAAVRAAFSDAVAASADRARSMG